jgi:hypothetical protein
MSEKPEGPKTSWRKFSPHLKASFSTKWKMVFENKALMEEVLLLKTKRLSYVIENRTSPPLLF